MGNILLNSYIFITVLGVITTIFPLKIQQFSLIGG